MKEYSFEGFKEGDKTFPVKPLPKEYPYKNAFICTISPSFFFRVREYTRDNGYWVYCSNPIFDYYEAVKEAIKKEKESGVKNHVELIII